MTFANEDAVVAEFLGASRSLMNFVDGFNAAVKAV